MLAVAIATWTPLAGQESKSETKSKVTRKEPKGRLPPYYKDVVTAEQREKIYEIQKKYAAQIEDLQSQLESLRQKQEEEIEAVLSKEQLEKVTALKSEADSKKRKKSDSKKADATTKADAK